MAQKKRNNAWKSVARGILFHSIVFVIVNMETNKCGGRIFSCWCGAALKFISLHEF